VVVTGQVQGVFYRDSCRREAQSRGVAGWVRNCPDGSVEAVFEGAPDAVEALVSWARVGPPHASVADVTVEDEQPEGLSGFTVR
jgi:acylphosphatase